MQIVRSLCNNNSNGNSCHPSLHNLSHFRDGILRRVKIKNLDWISSRSNSTNMRHANFLVFFYCYCLTYTRLRSLCIEPYEDVKREAEVGSLRGMISIKKKVRRNFRGLTI